MSVEFWFQYSGSKMTIIGNKWDRKLRGVPQKLLYLETYKDIYTIAQSVKSSCEGIHFW